MKMARSPFLIPSPLLVPDAPGCRSPVLLLPEFISLDICNIHTAVSVRCRLPFLLWWPQAHEMENSLFKTIFPAFLKTP
jgi:hypothetical protein